jgi:hypothetical protein
VTPNDGQIDLLIRRFAAHVPVPGDGDGHLDADELNAFAEGALPLAARSRYVSHLAECDQCRRQATDLAIASGAVVRVAPEVSETPERRSLWATLVGSLSLPVLRYAAFAAVLIIVAGVAFVALRRRSEGPTLVASNEPRQEQPVSAVKPQTPAGDVQNREETNKTSQPPQASQTPVPGGVISTTDGLPKFDNTKAPATIAPAEASKEIAAAEMEPMKKTESVTVQSKPGYAPAPPGESQSGRFGQSQTQTGAAQSVGGGVKMQQQADKSQAEDRDREAGKDARLDDAARQRANDYALAQQRAADEKQKGGPSRNMSNTAMNNNSNEVLRTESPRKSDGPPAGEEGTQTRSVGGRKFSRQGNRWVDQKFKSSMSLINISRGSDEFAALDSGLRSIALQLSGDVIVVRKGKAYLIR